MVVKHVQMLELLPTQARKWQKINFIMKNVIFGH